MPLHQAGVTVGGEDVAPGQWSPRSRLNENLGFSQRLMSGNRRPERW
jgi:hypothetical protein